MALPDLQDIPIHPSVIEVCLAVLLVALVYGAGTVAAFILGRFAERFPTRRLFFKRLQTLPQLGTYVASVYLIIRIFTPEQASLYAILGSIALALALAAQDLLKDIIGGIVVLVDKPYQVGDRIRLDDFDGEVTHIGLRSTRLVTSGRLITIPNSKMLAESVSNINAGEVSCPVLAHIYLSGPVDLALVEHIVRDAVLTAKTVYLKKPISIDIKDELLEESSVTHLEIRAYVFDSRYERMLPTDITRRVKKALFAQGIITATPPLAILRDRGMAIEELDKRVHLALAEDLMALGVRFAHRNHGN